MTVVVLLSDKRSGSTMLEEEICRHPDISTVDYTPHTFRETHHFTKGAVMLGVPPRLSLDGRRHGGYGSPANARAYLLDCVRTNVPGFVPPADDRALVFEGWEALCARFARPVFFEKSPQHLASWGALFLLLEWIGTTSRPVRIIGLTRNPLAVQASAEKLFGTEAESRQYSWLLTQRNLLAFAAMLPEGTYTHVRYEDIVAHPEETIAGLYAFIGVDPEKAAGRSTHVSATSLDKWRDDPAFTLQLAPEVRQMARAFGYRDEELDNPVPADRDAAHPGRRARRPARRYLAFRDRFLKPLLIRSGVYPSVRRLVGRRPAREGPRP